MSYGLENIVTFFSAIPIFLTVIPETWNTK